MKIRYIGGRSRYDVALNRKSYYFTPENNRILDTEDQHLIDYIFHLPNSAEFQVVVEPQEVVFNPQNSTVTTNSVQSVEISKPKIIKKSKSKKEKK